MKIIDLLNKIANGEDVPKKIRIDHWCYKFEWIEHESNYYDKHEDIDLMSCLSCDKEELNYEVHEIEEEKKENFTGWKMYQDGKVVCSIEGLKKENKIEKIDIKSYVLTSYNKIAILDLQNKVNELIDEVNKLKEK